jgi:hypothetical protein
VAALAMIGVPSPRNIAPVIECHEKLRAAHPEITFFYAKYYPELYAYKIIRDFFLNKTSFEYLAIAPDDLTFSVADYDKLILTLERERFPVFSGVCNLTMVSGQASLLNICIEKPVPIPRRERHYAWANVKDPRLPQGVTKVAFAGFPLMFIKREIVDKIGFQGDLEDAGLVLRKHRIPSSFDTVFCWRCHEQNIPIHVDTSVRLLHLKGADSSYACHTQVEDRLTGKEPPLSYAVTGTKSEDYTDYYRRWISMQNIHGDPRLWVAQMCGKAYA